MLSRKIESALDDFYHDGNRKALLLTGARQVGKTFSVRNFGKSRYEGFVEINFIRTPDAQKIFSDPADEHDILLRLSAFTKNRLIPGKTLIFFDEGFEWL